MHDYGVDLIGTTPFIIMLYDCEKDFKLNKIKEGHFYPYFEYVLLTRLGKKVSVSKGIIKF